MMPEQNRPSKTLGPRSAALVTALHERGRLIFTLADARGITGLKETSARTLVHKLVGRGVATRLRPGVFQLVPLELGRESEYLGNPYVVARELMGGRPYYFSHASAMDIHNMVRAIAIIDVPRIEVNDGSWSSGGVVAETGRASAH